MRGADAIHVDLAIPPPGGGGKMSAAHRRWFRPRRRRRDHILALAGWRHIVGRRDRVAFARLVNLHRIAVEIRVGEMAGRAAKVDQREIELLGILVHAGAAPDDLLELGHRANLAVEHDQAAGLRIDAGREQPRGGDEDGIFQFRVDEIAELILALLVAAGDAHDIAVVLGARGRRSR